MQVAHPSIIATIVLALVYIGLARLWYSKALFGGLFASTCEMKKDEPKDKEGCGCTASPAQQILAFLQALVMAFVLGYVVNAFQPADAVDGLKIGFFSWLGFIAMNELSSVVWAGRSLINYFIDIGFTLVVFAIWGAVFAMWH